MEKNLTIQSIRKEDGIPDAFEQIAELVDKREQLKLEDIKDMLIKEFLASCEKDPFLALAEIVVKREQAIKKAHTDTLVNVILDDAYIQEGISKSSNKGSFSDGYHTFDELYEFRKIYNAALFNTWAKEIGSSIIFGSDPTTPAINNKYSVHKSMRHYTGEECFGGGWFIVVAVLPTGQISNHYEMKDWDLFKVPYVPTALFPFDGHTGEDVLKRLKQL